MVERHRHVRHEELFGVLMRRIRNLIVALAVVVAGLVGLQSPASADPPPPGYACMYIANNDPTMGPGGTLVYADWDYITTSYVRAACWVSYLGGEINCTFYVRYDTAGNTSGPYGKICRN